VKNLSESEWALLKVLWERERATAREVTEALSATRGWAYSTVKTMLERLVEKGAVSGRKVGRAWEFSPAITPEQARRSAWRKFVDKAFGGALDPALRFLATETELTASQREALRALLDDIEAPDASPPDAGAGDA